MRRTDAQQGFSSAAADADVIVVGCGLAGLSAALAAAQRRARVVLFDSSSDLFATNDVADRLYFNAVDPERQGDLGITDSPELFYRQTLAAGGGRADPALVKILCYQAYIALKWLEGFGVGFENKVRQIPGGVYPRTCVASDYRAGRLAMMNAALDAGVTVLQGLTFRELVLDAQGRVTGVAAEDADGRRRILRAPATVLATGGFASDAALCARHDRRLGALFDMRGGRASGLGLRAAVKAGAYLVGTDYFSLTMGTAGRAGFAVCPFHPLRFILVDASGGRVVNEQDREAVVEALLDAPGNVLWLAASFSDVARLPEVRRGRIEALLAEGTARRVTGSEDMAGMEGAPSRASIVDAVRTYGEGSGDRLGKSWRVRIDDNDMLVMPHARSIGDARRREDRRGRARADRLGRARRGALRGRRDHGRRARHALRARKPFARVGRLRPRGGLCCGGSQRLTAGRMRASLSGLRPDPECGRSRLRSGP